MSAPNVLVAYASKHGTTREVAEFVAGTLERRGLTVELEDARNAYGRAIQAKPNYAEAHYNLSFVLSNLGDYDGALRATKRALEIDPYYVPQKFELAIDLEYEDPELSIAPDLGGVERQTESVEEFAFDPRLLDSLFTELSPTPSAAPAVAETDPYAMASDYLS